MRSYFYIVVLLIACFFAQDGLAQTRTVRRTAENNNNTGLPELSVRARAKNEGQSVDINNVVWLRILYRTIDLKKEANAPLYFPTEPIGDRMNLFTLMFKLIMERKLTVYEYLDGREDFTDQHKIVDLEKLLQDSRVVYKKTGTGVTAVLTIDPIDMPDVLAYMIKEVYYFDQTTGTFGSQVLAICPMRTWEGDYGESMRTPMFWAPYENIRPYISRSLIMTSNYNNALTYTADDFFQMKMYQGDIIKTMNMTNQTLAQQFPDSAKLIHAQDSIERQLKDFEARLWLPKDTVQKVMANEKTKKVSQTKTGGAADTRSAIRGAHSNANTNTTKTSAPKTKTEKASSTPTRSVRRR
ncbi:MAG: gliding motility protein GldN [Candidatus Azobacteroides sp.]|nr:gliding motility protein GldN [Candidatus Azobacteroides sp.]